MNSSSPAALDSWLDVAGLLPPLPLEISQKIFSQTGGDTSGSHTFLPNLLSEADFTAQVLPHLQKSVAPDLLKFITTRVKKTFDLRATLKKLAPQIEALVGKGNFSALWLDREAFSADSMEHRALITEAVVHVYSASALQSLVALFYKHKVPMIPYGEGGGYNMGVTPMAPAVTVSVRGIDHISNIRPSRRTPGKFEIAVGAGVPFKDLVAYLGKRGFVLRCDPNTPRAATGGIAATGSNGGRKAFEVILHGRAVAAQGSALCFAADAAETECINSEPFLLARKFFSIQDVSAFRKTFDLIVKRQLPACVEPQAHGIKIPLVGMKASANMIAQSAESKLSPDKNNGAVDTMQGAPTLPISAFVGAEGSTGFIYEVTFEIEKPLPYLKAGRWHFKSVEGAMAATKAIKALPHTEHPEFFEVISGQSIRRFLIHDFPSVFSEADEAVLILGIEGETATHCEKRFDACLHAATSAVADMGLVPAQEISRQDETSTLLQAAGIEEFEIMRRPREELPKKLRTKCKTDMEIRTEYLGEVLKIVEATQPRARASQKQDVLFGHLTPNHTAIIHWNIGGFDLYDEEQADIAWSYLENVIGKAQSLAPANDPHGSARFTGEHGVAGKAPFLWLNYIPQTDFERMCAVKDVLDPQDLFNPETLFLRTSHSRSLRARLLNISNSKIADAQVKNRLLSAAGNGTSTGVAAGNASVAALDFAIAEGQRCTRCNSCKICPVIDAEHELEREGKRNSSHSVLPSKRNILMFLERMAVVKRSAASTGNAQTLARVEAVTSAMIAESAQLLKKCFYCRKCDKACPVDIQIHPLMRAYHAMGKLPSMGSRLWGFLYERLMGEDFFKAYTYKIMALFMLFGKPFLRVVRALPFVPDWLKTYTVPPTLVVNHYEPLREGVKLRASDNFVMIDTLPQKKSVATSTQNDGQSAVQSVGLAGHDRYASQTVYIRYRGCMDTFGNPEATRSVDSYFRNVLGARIVDLEKKMCCGFPFEADGLHERAKQSQFLSMVEIAKCVHRVMEEWRTGGYGAAPKFGVFSNCPTCCEAIKEMKLVLAQPDKREHLRLRAQLPSGFDFKLLEFEVSDTAEIAMNMLQKSKKAGVAARADSISALETARLPLESAQENKINKVVGLKVPCHNTKAATEAQLALLRMYYGGVAAYDRCCGLSGTGRLKHPKIGTKISEKLFEQIREVPPDVVVSGCPSCRDGVQIQRDILSARKEIVAEFEISGIFEQILKDCQPERLT